MKIEFPKCGFLIFTDKEKLAHFLSIRLMSTYVSNADPLVLEGLRQAYIATYKEVCVGHSFDVAITDPNLQETTIKEAGKE